MPWVAGSMNTLHGCFSYAKVFRKENKLNTVKPNPRFSSLLVTTTALLQGRPFYSFPGVRSGSLCGAMNALCLLQNLTSCGRFERSRGLAGDELKERFCCSILLPCTGPSCKMTLYLCIDFFTSQTTECT